MDFNEYKEKKLNEIDSYKNKLYDNYIDQIKSINNYIVALSSSGIVAMFLFLYKFGVKDQTLANMIVYIKFVTVFFMLSLLLIILVNFLYSIETSKLEIIYSDLYNKISKLTDKQSISTLIKTEYTNILVSFHKKYKFYDFLRYVAYLFFLFGLLIISYLIIVFKVNAEV